MGTERTPDLRLEIGHVLFIDIVGYSKLLIDEQREVQHELNDLVRNTAQFSASDAGGKLTRLPTGDGMALIFRDSMESPLRCAIEISRALKDRSDLRLRMGIHSGPVSEVADVNDRSNVAGAGMNIAQRVMDCGDAGHILLSKHLAEDLSHYRHWQPHLHDLGECEVKHGVRLGLVNFYDGEAGNPAAPQKCATAETDPIGVPIAPPREGTRRLLLPLAALATLLLIGGGYWLLTRNNARNTAPPAPAKSAGAIASEKSIAVLPFQNLSKDEENAFFADGVQDQILTDLAKVADLKVISRTSVMQYKNVATRNLRDIAQQLGVAHVLEGSVQRAAGKVRVTAQLINALTDAHEWAENYDRPVDDVFAIQSEVAQKIADQLRAAISPREKAAIATAPTTDVTANTLYAHAIKLESTKPEHESFLKAVDILDEATTRDPRFLLAYCALSRVNLELFWGGYDRTPARRDRANSALQKAVALDPDAGEVHVALALYAYWGFRDYDRARAELETARRTLPNAVDVFYITAIIDHRQGRWTEAIRNFNQAIALDPRNEKVLGEAAVTHHNLRQYAQAIELERRAVAVAPRSQDARIGLAYEYLHAQGDVRPLRAAISEITTEEPGSAAGTSDSLFLCAIFERDRGAAAQALALIPPTGVLGRGNFINPREWFAAIMARTFGDVNGAATSFAAARDIVATTLEHQPDNAAGLALLSDIDAGLGRKKEAVQEALRACELLPISKDARVGSGLIANLASVYAWVGDKDRAFEQLATSAGLPSGVTYGNLKLDPQWDPLRGDPRFDAIVASLKPRLLTNED